MPNETKWTTAQKLAIETTDSDVLVTASAGTGKTAVLAQRCVNILADQQNPTDVSQILVLTFTEASAEEMKQRIAEQLAEEIEKNSSPYLRRQLLMLDAAHISTIDAFCKKIITENFHLLAIDPTFRIIDPDEQKLIRSEVLSEVIEQAFNDPQLCPAIMNLLENRGVTTPDKGFLTSILDVSGFLQTHLSPKNWFNLAATLTDITNIYTSDLAKRQQDMILKKLLQCESMLKYAIRIDDALTEDNFFTDHLNSEYLAPIKNAIESINSGTGEYIKIITAFKPANFKRKPKDLAKETADLIKDPVSKVKKIISKLADLAVINPKYEQVVTPLANLQTKTMLELVRRFNQQYAKIKQQTNCLDFADLEHNMIKLLETSPKTAKLLKNQFRYIFVDEYQDTNNLQQGILEKISRQGNVFVVGDIKQSIYAFRQAKPEIFLNRLNEAEKTSALRVDLADNFRSRDQILNFANTIFERIMTAQVASIDYDEKAILKPGFDYEPSKTPFVELNLIDEEADIEPDNEVTLRQRQAALIAQKIQSIIGTFDVYDKQTKNYRPVEYRDIVILMRAPSATVADYIDILRLAAVPVQSKSNAGYFEATEISDMISLLKILDNPQRDIELTAVLRSPIFNTTDTELAQIRNHAETANAESAPSFYDCLLSYADAGEGDILREKLNRILDQLNTWRTLARRSSLADLIYLIYRQTGHLAFVSALPNGKQRKANLLKLHDRAIQFESFTTNARTVSLTRFVEFLEKLNEADHDWAPAQPDTSTENTVRIMSVHNSKGLEFPVVFLADLDRKFNTQDTASNCLIDDINALGLQVIHPESKSRLTTIAHQIIAQKKRDAMYAEEMRILYVAITRARERLYLSASAKISKCTQLANAASILADHPLHHWQLTSAKSPLDWILYGLAHTKKLQSALDIESNPINTEDLLDINIIDPQKLNNTVNTLKQKRTSPPTQPSKPAKASKKLLEKINASLNFQYPDINAAKTLAKISVTQYTHADDEFAQTNYTNAFTRQPAVLETETKTQTPQRLVGTATHLVMETIDITKPVTEETIKSAITQLNLTDELAKKIDAKKILTFFQTDIGKQTTDPNNTVHREWPFIIAIPSADLTEKPTEETVIVQGIVDMIIETPDDLIIVDFKTDRITAAQTNERAKLYAKQLNLYAKAAAQILNKNVAHKYLYFTTPAKTVKIAEL